MESLKQVSGICNRGDTGFSWPLTLATTSGTVDTVEAEQISWLWGMQCDSFSKPVLRLIDQKTPFFLSFADLLGVPHALLLFFCYAASPPPNFHHGDSCPGADEKLINKVMWGERAYVWVHSTLGRSLAWLFKVTRGPSPGAGDVYSSIRLLV